MRGHLAELLAVVGQVHPISQGVGSVNTGAIPMKVGAQTLFIVQTGVMGASGTIDFRVQGSVGSGFSSPVDITGAALTQIVKASGDNRLALLVLDNSVVQQQNPTLTHIRGLLTVGTAASLVAVTAIQGYLFRSEAADFDLAAVAEIRALVS